MTLLVGHRKDIVLQQFLKDHCRVNMVNGYYNTFVQVINLLLIIIIKNIKISVTLARKLQGHGTDKIKTKIKTVKCVTSVTAVRLPKEASL